MMATPLTVHILTLDPRGLEVGAILLLTAAFLGDTGQQHPVCASDPGLLRRLNVTLRYVHIHVRRRATGPERLITQV